MWVRYPAWTAVQAWGLPMASPPAEGTLTSFAPGPLEAAEPSRPARPRPLHGPASDLAPVSAPQELPGGPQRGPAQGSAPPSRLLVLPPGPAPAPAALGLGITHDACARWAPWRCRGYGRRSPRGRAALPGWGAATGSAWPPGAMAALAVVFLLLWVASWPSASASGEEFWPGQSAADILSGAASRRR